MAKGGGVGVYQTAHAQDYPAGIFARRNTLQKTWL